MVETPSPGQAGWRDIVPEREDAVIESLSFGRGLMAVTWLRNASNFVEVFDLDGTSRGILEQPGIGSTQIATEEDRTEAYLLFTSFNHPTSIYRVDLANPGAEPELWEQPAVPVDRGSVEVEQVWYPSKDGTPISMFLVHRRDLELNSAVPTLLYGYGGFNISMTPAFSATLFQWFEAGGLYAVPNLRGGGEYGDNWHEAGMLDRKQNVFDDFVAAAEWLFANGYTNSEKLAISGGSNGGLLTGTVLTQRPDLCRAHAAPRLVSGGHRGGAAARHAAVPELPDGSLLGARVRIGRESRSVRDSRQLLAVSSRAAGHVVPGGDADRRRARHPRACPSCPEDDGGPAGGDRLRSVGAPGAPVGRSGCRPRTGEAAQPAAA